MLQAPLSMEFSRQEYWSGLQFPSPGNLPDPWIKPRSPTLQADLEMATNSSSLAWKIPWTEEPGRLHGVAKSRTRLNNFTSLLYCLNHQGSPSRFDPFLLQLALSNAAFTYAWVIVWSTTDLHNMSLMLHRAWHIFYTHWIVFEWTTHIEISYSCHCFPLLLISNHHQVFHCIFYHSNQPKEYEE